MSKSNIDNSELFPCPEYISSDKFIVYKYGKSYSALFNPSTGSVDIYSEVGDKGWVESISPENLLITNSTGSYRYPELKK